jgi:rhodanese-related sulfurtransferase
VNSLWQALAILVAGAALGLSSNIFRERPLPFSGPLDPPPEREAGSDLAAGTLEEALSRFEEGAFFLDVRPAADWESRRVSGAFSVPADEFDDRYFLTISGLGTEVPLFVYGAGPDSHVVRRVVAQLSELGHEQVGFVTGGVDALLAAGLSAASGPEEGR